MVENAAPATGELLQVILDYPSAQVVHAVARLGLADLLADSPRSVEELAAAAGAHAPSLQRLVRALTALGIMVEASGGRVELTSLGAPLRSDVPGSVRDAVLFLTGEWFWSAWGGLLHSVRTGEPAFDRVFGMSNFEYWGHDPEAGAIHDAFFRTTARITNAPIVAAYNFSRFGTVVDVGGSTGGLLGAILQANPGLRGILFDLPHVVSGAGPALAEAGVADRCAVVSGSFFESVPEGGDAYILKYVIHDERAVAVLRRCREAMAPGAVLLVIEQVVPERLDPGAAARRVTRHGPADAGAHAGRARAHRARVPLAARRGRLRAARRGPHGILPRPGGRTRLASVGTQRHDPCQRRRPGSRGQADQIRADLPEP